MNLRRRLLAGATIVILASGLAMPSAWAQPTPSSTPIGEDTGEDDAVVEGVVTERPAETDRGAPAGQSSPGALSRTGSDVLRIALVAFIIIAIGGGLLLAGRRAGDGDGLSSS